MVVLGIVVFGLGFCVWNALTSIGDLRAVRDGDRIVAALAVGAVVRMQICWMMQAVLLVSAVTQPEDHGRGEIEIGVLAVLATAMSVHDRTVRTRVRQLAEKEW